ncbi:hypothetical protein RDI58_025448 [Solanum bulbocastanum]|uniref:Transmembrane protein n=1 Tax=Solanum bulbocastanum TaxID=147425 RepID=A0AAN8SZH1_SOLBU
MERCESSSVGEEGNYNSSDNHSNLFLLFAFFELIILAFIHVVGRAKKVLDLCLFRGIDQRKGYSKRTS